MGPGKYGVLTNMGQNKYLIMQMTVSLRTIMDVSNRY